jgi:hypothetical protein
MERIVIRPARASDAADLARNWIEGAQHYVERDPESFRVPSTDGLVEFFEESLGMTAWTESTSLRIWRLGFESLAARTTPQVSDLGLLALLAS